MDAEAALYIVATPIGNLGDMVPRAVEILQTVELIAAEDTRHSRRLLDHFQIETRMIAYHEHSSANESQRLIDRLKEGGSIALISDAGTPLVSDPGYGLVDQAIAAGIKVVPVPGPSAAITALSAAGLPSDRFVFEGFLPAKSGPRAARLKSMAAESRTLIYYEAPHRIVDTLTAMLEAFGEERVVVLARELTKTYETIRRAPLGELLQWVESDPNQQRGEMVLLVKGAEGLTELSDEHRRLVALLMEELPIKKAAALAAKITGLPKAVLYQAGLESRSE